MHVILDGIPAALRDRPHWVMWRLIERDGRPTKAPYQLNGTLASSTNPETWSDFDSAYQYRSRFDGVGIVLTEGLAGVDLDHCRDAETGEIAPWAWEIIRELDSYSEVSPSGTGVKVFLMAAIPPGGHRIKYPDEHSEVEMYSEGRYFTVTGHRMDDVSGGVEERQAQLDGLHGRLFGARQDQTDAPPAAQPVALADGELLERARAASNGPKFCELWDGGGGDDRSAGDQALCNMLAFWTGGDAGRIDALFRTSARLREKWDKRHRGDGATYGQMTIERALSSTTEFYLPGVRDAPEVREADWDSRLASAGPTPVPPKTPSDAPASERQTEPSPAATGTEPQQGRRQVYMLTDLGNAERLVARHGERLHYAFPMRKWIVWDGRRWAIDDVAQVQKLTVETVRAMNVELKLLTFDADAGSPYQQLRKHILKAEGAARLRAMQELSQGVGAVPILPADLDTDPWLFNVSNGTLNLRTGQLEHHRRGDLITKLCPVCYEAGAECALWQTFLERVTAGDQDLQRFLQVIA